MRTPDPDLSRGRRAALHLACALLLGALFVLPDFVYALTREGLLRHPRVDLYLLLCGIAALALTIRSRAAFVLFVLWIAVLQAAQLLHHAYFGTLVAPHEVGVVVADWHEISRALVAMLPRFVPPALLVIVANALACAVWRFARPRVLAPPGAAWLLPVVFVLPLYRAHHSHQTAFHTDASNYSVLNTLYAASMYAADTMKASGDAHFAPYRVTRAAPTVAPSIVVVMGESLTPGHMHLFGYPRDTTPGLDRLAADPRLVYREALSSGITTKVSLPTFFNVVREPGNQAQILGQATNLFRLAKEAGYATYYISTQRSDLLAHTGAELADRHVTVESIEPLYERLKDDALLDELSRIELDENPAFVVLHQRNSHVPYRDDYPPEFEVFPSDAPTFAEQTVNAYDNSVRYTDHLLAKLIATLNERHRERPIHLVFVSDHGELLGEGGRYGHTSLGLDVARVPFIAFSVGASSDDGFATLREIDSPTHYEIGKAIAALLGYRIENPNESGARFYVNGVDLDVRAGCLAAERDHARWRVVADPLCPP